MSSNDEPQKGAAPVVNAPTLAETIAAAMAEASEVTKSSTNTEQNYKFASAEAILGAVRKPLLARGVILLPDVVDLVEHEITSRSSNKGTRVVLTVRFTFTNGREELVREWRGEGQDYGDKAYGKAYTNAVKTFIRSAWLLPTEHDDPEGSPSGERVSGTAAAAELPAWALPVSTPNMNVLKRRLVTLLGVDEAKLALETIRGSLDSVPALVNMTAGLILEAILKSNPDELVGRLADEQARRLDAARKAEAAAEAERQAGEKAEAEKAHEAAEEGDLAAAQAAEDDVAPTDVVAEPEPERLATDAPGTVSPPDLTGDTVVVAMKKLRDAGCICKEPLAEDAQSPDNDKIDTACPLIGHGIAF